MARRGSDISLLSVLVIDWLACSAKVTLPKCVDTCCDNYWILWWKRRKLGSLTRLDIPPHCPLSPNSFPFLTVSLPFSFTCWSFLPAFLGDSLPFIPYFPFLFLSLLPTFLHPYARKMFISFTFLSYYNLFHLNILSRFFFSIHLIYCVFNFLLSCFLKLLHFFCFLFFLILKSGDGDGSDGGGSERRGFYHIPQSLTVIISMYIHRIHYFSSTSLLKV